MVGEWLAIQGLIKQLNELANRIRLLEARLEKADTEQCCPSTIDRWGGAGPDCCTQPGIMAGL